MMPIFFNAESHFWIAYLFFVNGFLLHCLFRCCSNKYESLTAPIEALALSSFFLSIGLNGLLLYCLGLVGWKFSLAGAILPVTTGLLCVLLWLNLWRWSISITTLLKHDYSWLCLGLYFFIFIVLFYNGGLIEQISDSWWHMSLANEIAFFNTLEINPNRDHLTGLVGRYYPQLWHGNLALANVLSSIPISTFWNSLTAWVSVLKVMAFYLFAYSLYRNQRFALLGALLFVLLPGIGNSYLRVSAWPSHIAYTAWYALFYASFALLDTPSGNSTAGPSRLKQVIFEARHFLSTNVAILIIQSLLLALIFFTHKAEVLWFAFGMLLYGTALTVYRAWSDNALLEFEHKLPLIMGAYRLAIAALMVAAIMLYVDQWPLTSYFSDKTVAYTFPIALSVLLLWASFAGNRYSPSWLIKWLLTATALLMLISINYTQLISLFDPELALPLQGKRTGPLEAIGLLGGVLALPGWHLQLRGGLLYAGVISVPLSLMLAYLRPNRVTLFLAANGCIVFLFCLSPYLYQWLFAMTNYHSPWRIALLIFHPLVFAYALVFFWDCLRSRTNGMAS